MNYRTLWWKEELSHICPNWIWKRTLDHFKSSSEVIITKIPEKNDYIASFKTKHSVAITEDFFSTKSSHVVVDEKSIGVVHKERVRKEGQ